MKKADKCSCSGSGRGIFLFPVKGLKLTNEYQLPEFVRRLQKQNRRNGIERIFLHILDLAGHMWYCMCRQKEAGSSCNMAAKTPGGATSGVFYSLFWNGRA